MQSAKRDIDFSDKQNDTKGVLIAGLQQQVVDLAAELKNLKSMIVSGTNSTPAISSNGYLRQNVPNPTANSTLIDYLLPSNTERGEIRITDSKGSNVKVYRVAKGAGQLTIKNGELSSGVYVYTPYVNSKTVDTKQTVISR